MNGLIVFVATAALGVEFGYQPATDGGLEYIVQVEPELIESMEEGLEITSDIPPEASNVSRIRVRIGKGMLPRNALDETIAADEVNRPMMPDPYVPADNTYAANDQGNYTVGSNLATSQYHSPAADTSSQYSIQPVSNTTLSTHKNYQASLTPDQGDTVIIPNDPTYRQTYPAPIQISGFPPQPLTSAPLTVNPSLQSTTQQSGLQSTPTLASTQTADLGNQTTQRNQWETHPISTTSNQTTASTQQSGSLYNPPAQLSDQQGRQTIVSSSRRGTYSEVENSNDTAWPGPTSQSQDYLYTSQTKNSPNSGSIYSNNNTTAENNYSNQNQYGNQNQPTNQTAQNQNQNMVPVNQPNYSNQNWNTNPNPLPQYQQYVNQQPAPNMPQYGQYPYQYPYHPGFYPQPNQLAQQTPTLNVASRPVTEDKTEPKPVVIEKVQPVSVQTQPEQRDKEKEPDTVLNIFLLLLLFASAGANVYLVTTVIDYHSRFNMLSRERDR